MGSFVYVGNLATSTTEDAVASAFASAGCSVRSVVVMRSSRNERSRGFGFVEVGSEEEIEPAIQAVNGKELDGRALAVDRVRVQRPGRDVRSFQHSSSGPRTGGARRSGGRGSRKSR